MHITTHHTHAWQASHRLRQRIGVTHRVLTRPCTHCTKLQEQALEEFLPPPSTGCPQPSRRTPRCRICFSHPGSAVLSCSSAATAEQHAQGGTLTHQNRTHRPGQAGKGGRAGGRRQQGSPHRRRRRHWQLRRHRRRWAAPLAPCTLPAGLQAAGAGTATVGRGAGDGTQPCCCQRPSAYRDARNLFQYIKREECLWCEIYETCFGLNLTALTSSQHPTQSSSLLQSVLCQLSEAWCVQMHRWVVCHRRRQQPQQPALAGDEGCREPRVGRHPGGLRPCKASRRAPSPPSIPPATSSHQQGAVPVPDDLRQVQVLRLARGVLHAAPAGSRRGTSQGARETASELCACRAARDLSPKTPLPPHPTTHPQAPSTPVPMPHHQPAALTLPTGWPRRSR